MCTDDEHLFEDIEDLRPEDLLGESGDDAGSEPGVEIDQLSIQSTPKPSLRPFFSGSVGRGTCDGGSSTGRGTCSTLVPVYPLSKVYVNSGRSTFEYTINAYFRCFMAILANS